MTLKLIVTPGESGLLAVQKLDDLLAYNVQPAAIPHFTHRQR